MKHKRSFAEFLLFAMAITVIMGRLAFFETPIPNASAVESTQNLGVYSDRNCHKRISSIDWGMLSPGELKEVVVYVKNEGNEALVLSLTLRNWNPQDASRYLSFNWNCESKKIEAGQVAMVAQELTVSPFIAGIYDFGFDIVFEAREHFLGDIDRDGFVDYLDFILFSVAYSSTPTDSNWNPNADLNKDSAVNGLDFFLFCNDYGKS